MPVFSSPVQLEKIAEYLCAYMRIPYFQDDTIPGKVMEKIISLVHDAKQLATYDYVDVCRDGIVGWQVKSTKDDTPLTWKRAKIADSASLIKESEAGVAGSRKLGNAIIDFCNQHAAASITTYKLDKIGLARLIMLKNNYAVYYEKVLCTKEQPAIFNCSDYEWHWSTPKQTTKKEQLPALHGINKHTGQKDFAWHGRGENQLHYSGERSWWPQIELPTKAGTINFSSDNHAIAFKLPSSKVSWDELTTFLNSAS